MQRYKILALSDTHLGEDSSLLSYPAGRQHLWDVLKNKLGGGERFQVDEMILMGDIPDRTLSSTSQIITHTNALMESIGSIADITTGIYIPGNHDHTLWTDYIKKQSGNGKKYRLSKPDGELIVKDGKRCDQKKCAEDILSIFFGYRRGSSWRRIEKEKKYNFKVANPIYAVEGDKRTYVFTHGTLFKSILTMSEKLRKFLDYIQADRLLGDIEIKSKGDLKNAENLAGLEKEIHEFVDTLWPSSKNNPTSRSDQLWYLLTMFEGKLDKHKRLPKGSFLFPMNELSAKNQNKTKKAAKGRIEKLSKKDKEMKNWDNLFRGHMMAFLEKHKYPTNKISFVFGDTHRGGWMDWSKNIRIYNTGAWVCHNPEHHPECHIYAVDENEDEHILDVSFSGIKIENKSLLKLAADEAENRRNSASRVMRFVVDNIL